MSIIDPAAAHAMQESRLMHLSGDGPVHQGALTGDYGFLND
jgi:hypothetical protein